MSQIRNFSFKHAIQDIRFWLSTFFLIRLIGITNPPLEGAHNWRQALTNMIARNLYYERTDFWHPMVDYGGVNTGVIGSEFPLFNGIIAVVSMVFGYDHWYGRLINLIVTTIGIYYFYRLIKQVFSEKLAFHSTIILSLSIWFSFGRKIMPDTFSVALVMIALFYGYNYLKSSRISSLFLFFIFSTLGVLVKIPALSLLAVASVLPFIKVSLRMRISLFLALLLSVSIAFAWYFYWVPHLIEVYHFELYFPKSLLQGLEEISNHIPDLLEKFYFSALFSFIGFTAVLIGLFYFLRDANWMHKLVLSAVSIVFGLFIVKTGSVFPTHSYYIVPFVPIMAILGAFCTTNLPSYYGSVLLLMIGVESVANQQHDFFIKPEVAYMLNSEKIVDQYVPIDEKIIVNTGPSPQGFYFFDKKGWNFSHDELSRPNFIDSLHHIGANYLVLDIKFGQDYTFIGRPIYQGNHFEIYKLGTN